MTKGSTAGLGFVVGSVLVPLELLVPLFQRCAQVQPTGRSGADPGQHARLGHNSAPQNVLLITSDTELLRWRFLSDFPTTSPPIPCFAETRLFLIAYLGEHRG